MIDFATLTGAARVAMGPEVVLFYTHDDALAADIGKAGAQCADPMWRLPLWAGYDSWLDSQIADVNHIKLAHGRLNNRGAVLVALCGKHHKLDALRCLWNIKSRAGHLSVAKRRACGRSITYLEKTYG